MSTNGHGGDPGRDVPDPAYVPSPFPPIGDYGFLSDCETTALIAPSGNVEWLCLPRIDSPSVLERSSIATPAGSDSAHPTWRCRRLGATCPGP